jgi:hypothetical protein
MLTALHQVPHPGIGPPDHEKRALLEVEENQLAADLLGRHPLAGPEPPLVGHHRWRHGRDAYFVLFLDTGFFEETLEFKRELTGRLGLSVLDLRGGLPLPGGPGQGPRGPPVRA